MKSYHKVLTIAGSDSGAGAGIQADLKTFSALGCYGLSVITAITAQNTLGVQAVRSLPPELISQQLDSVLSDIGTNAIKIGMLGDSTTIKTVSKRLQSLQSIPIVVDPVMVAKGGSALLAQNAITTLREELLPLTTLLTPNIPETECLLAIKINSARDMEKAAQELCRLGAQAVLVKGGHLDSQDNSNDYLYIQSTSNGHWFHQARIHTQNTHGTGCTLSAAIAALLAQGKPLLEAVNGAKHYLTCALQAGSQYQLGKGHGPVHHFYQAWES